MKISKIHTKITLFAIASLLVVTSCREDRSAELGEPLSKIEGLVATPWVISEVYIVDGADPANASRDFSSYYASGESLLSLNFNEDGTFQVQPGDGVNFLPEGGTWEFDNNEYPSRIIMNGGDVDLELQLEAPTRIIEQQLKVRYDKYACELDGEIKPVYSYRMVFNRDN